MTTPRCLIIGGGLMGASLGLALRGQEWPVWLRDTDQRAEALAVDLGAGEPGLPPEAPGIVFLAVPPDQVALVAIETHRLYPKSTISDLGSVKANLQLEIESQLSLNEVFVGGHPLAGRERTGPAAARADLFEGRPWVLTPGAAVAASRVAAVVAAVTACGAVPVVMEPRAHDEAVALVSHAPQVASSALAARLAGAPTEALALSGQGLRDTVRIAASDPQLWVEILQANAGPVAEVLRGLVADLQHAVDALDAVSESADRQDDESINASREVLRDLIDRGNVGSARIPGKHGSPPAAYSQVRVVIADEPGGLAALFLAAGEAGVNIEDVRLEHSPGQPVGLVELSVQPQSAKTLGERLRAAGWSVH